MTGIGTTRRKVTREKPAEVALSAPTENLFNARNKPCDVCGATYFLMILHHDNQRMCPRCTERSPFTALKPEHALKAASYERDRTNGWQTVEFEKHPHPEDVPQS